MMIVLCNDAVSPRWTASPKGADDLGVGKEDYPKPIVFPALDLAGYPKVMPRELDREFLHLALETLHRA
jgi:hypothetical protein